MNPLLKKILIAVGILAVLFVGYRVFVKDEPEELLTSETPSDIPVGESDLLSVLLELKSITLPDAIFSDSAFATLQDFTVQLSPEPIGRRNPFAAIGAEPPRASTTTPATE